MTTDLGWPYLIYCTCVWQIQTPYLQTVGHFIGCYKHWILYNVPKTEPFPRWQVFLRPLDTFQSKNCLFLLNILVTLKSELLMVKNVHKNSVT